MHVPRAAFRHQGINQEARQEEEEEEFVVLPLRVSTRKQKVAIGHRGCLGFLVREMTDFIRTAEKEL